MAKVAVVKALATENEKVSPITARSIQDLPRIWRCDLNNI